MRNVLYCLQIIWHKLNEENVAINKKKKKKKNAKITVKCNSMLHLWKEIAKKFSKDKNY